MAQPLKPYNVNLDELNFPFLIHDFPLTNLVSDSRELPSRVIRPRILHCENVFPSVFGMVSTDKKIIFPDPATTGGEDPQPVTGFDSVFSFYDDQGNFFLYSPCGGAQALAGNGANFWKICYPNKPQNQYATIAYIMERFYSFFAGDGLYSFDSSAVNMVPMNFIGISASQVFGITSAASYFIAYDSDTIYYTQVFSSGIPDFTPLLNNAGSLKPLHVKGPINECVPIANGFIIYTDNNAVSAQYSGNPSNPFVFREVPGSSGVRSKDEVSAESNLGSHFVWSLDGFQEVRPSAAQNVFPEVTEFIHKHTIETFDYTTGEIIRRIFDRPLAVKIKSVKKRYICISYGEAQEYPQEYEEAVIYDLELKKWGKIRTPHVDIFDYTYLGIFNYFTYNDLENVTYDDLASTRYNELFESSDLVKSPQSQVSVLKRDGRIFSYEKSNVLLLNDELDAPDIQDAGKVLFGRISVGSMGITSLEEIQMQNIVETDSSLSVFVSDNSDPLDFSSRVSPMSRPRSNLVGRWNMRGSHRHFAIGITGRFDINSIQLLTGKTAIR